MIPTRLRRFSFLRNSLLALLTLSSALLAQETITWRNPELSALQLTSAPQTRSTLQLLAARPDTRHFIIQFDRAVSRHLRARLAGTGIQLLNPLGSNAYFASLNAATLDADAVVALGIVRSVQEVTSFHRMHPTLASGDVPTWSVVEQRSGEAPIVAAYVKFHPDVDLEVGGRTVVRFYGGRVVDVVESVGTLVVEMPHPNLLALASADEVQWIEPPLPRMREVSLNDSSRVSIQASQVQAAPYDLDGSGVSVLVYDGGSARASHNDFAGRLTVRDSSGLSNHATHVSGTVGGDGSSGGGTHAGMAPAVTIESYGFEYDGSGVFLYTNPGDIEDDYDEAINTYGVDLSNNSIGTNTEPNGFLCSYQGDYGITSELIDSIVGGSLGAPFRVVWANGNERQGSTCDIEGYGDYYSTAPPATAKNHITVGAANSNNDSMTSFSSWGPTDDGRIKPDISGPGCQSNGDGGVTSTSSSSDTAYSVACGTSMAAPAVTGALSLLLEDHRVQFPASGDPRNSTFKALLAQTASDEGNVGPDYQFGYGVVKIKDAIDHMRSGRFREDQLDHQAGSYVYEVTVGAGQDLQVTLAWDDAPGTPNVFKSLVNDLDLVVTSPGGTRHYPWTLDPANPSFAAVQTSEDHLNNIEQVSVSSAQVGTWTIEVFGFDIPSGPQPFSITASHDLTLAPAVQISFVNDLPTRLTPDLAHTVTAQVIGLNDTVVGGSPTLHVRYDGGSYLALPMTSIGGDQFQADLPPGVCTATPEFYFSASGASSGPATNPLDAPTTVYQATMETATTLFSDDFETDQGWSVTNVSLTDGPWERGDPAGDGGRCDPLMDHDGSGQCYLTDNVLGNSDVDGGPTRLTSPTLDLASSNDPTVRYAYWMCTNTFDTDRLEVEISANGGSSWTLVDSIQDSGGWAVRTFRVLDYVTPTSNVQVRFNVDDNPNDSVIEAAIDAFLIQDTDCTLVLDDCNGNGIVDSDDIASGRSTDGNTNGTPDECESNDCNNNGVDDALDISGGTSQDCNSNGLPDECELAGNDCNSNGVPDECDADCNTNGTPDDCESFTDCNSNSIPDECELAGNDCNSNGAPDECDTDCNSNGTPDDCESFADCNSNAVPDECELAGNDCNSNGTPDECDTDCNSNGTPDDCESFADCNSNAIPDECELAGNDCNSNAIPDECDTDCNSNGTPDACESFTDCNSDGIPDECQLTGNDCNLNGVPDDCDSDCNSNGTPDDCEPITDCNSNSVPDECELTGNDCNTNGVPDECDDDCNTNGTPDDCESFADCNSSGIPDECELAGNDCNSNGVPDECDTDCNSNGTPDECESFTDCNSNAIPDECELAGNDCNSNGVPDDCDTDCNSNGTPDACESFTDCNSDGIPDECQIAGNDCNSNGIPDECDIDCNTNGTPDDCESFADCNSNSVPDECELAGNDCNSNGTPDECDTDCNSNGTPDSCESYADCNSNSIPDECELAGNDCNSNGAPDECDTDCNSNGTPDDCESFTDCNSNSIPDECELTGNDCNTNGVPDECDDDCNTNGTPDDCESFADCNSDGIPDECQLTGNDCNSNGVPDDCDTDCNSNGTPDECEAFADCNSDSIPDECQLAGNDCNSNGVPDDCDADCNSNGTPDSCEAITDCNSDGIPDECQLGGNDCNSNGVLDECDPDCNANGTPDDCESFADCNSDGIPDECQVAGNDCNANGVPDECDTDCNANGTPDDCEALTDCNSNGVPDECELVGNDCNSNGIPDDCDTDCNANGTPDDCEALTDCNSNGVPDECELSGNDCNTNGVPDECDTDCNSNGTPDDCESFNDCNSNSVPDECELAGNDCNSNGAPDECDTDCNTNGTPDDCESFTDCNSNSIPDECELAGNDCNANGVPDECDTDCNASGTPDDCEAFADCNSNGTPDECDIAAGTSQDWNLDGIPDDCGPAIVYCSGDGSGTACPCGNTGSPGSGCANSGSTNGAAAVATGSASVGSDDLVINGAELLPGAPGLLFSGLTQINGGNGNPFGDGLRCVGGHVTRMNVRIPDANGMASWGPGLATSFSWSSGETRTFQIWYRDTNGLCGSGFNLTNGLEVTLTP